MTSFPPIVYCIHGSDAPQHLGKLQALMSQFETEKRVEDFIPLEIENELALLTERFKADDVIVLFLTAETDRKRKDISNLLSNIKSKFLGSVIVEIIIDNVYFDDKHLTLPKNLRPIRDVQDMDLTWNDIEEHLKQILPAHKTQKNQQLSKYLKYAIIIVLLLILLIWRPWESNSAAPTTDPAPYPQADTSQIK